MLMFVVKDQTQKMDDESGGDHAFMKFVILNSSLLKQFTHKACKIAARQQFRYIYVVSEACLV